MFINTADILKFNTKKRCAIKINYSISRIQSGKTTPWRTTNLTISHSLIIGLLLIGLLMNWEQLPASSSYKGSSPQREGGRTECALWGRSLNHLHRITHTSCEESWDTSHITLPCKLLLEDSIRGNLVIGSRLLKNGAYC